MTRITPSGIQAAIHAHVHEADEVRDLEDMFTGHSGEHVRNKRFAVERIRLDQR